MKQLFKQLIIKTPIYAALIRWDLARKQEKAFTQWERQGKHIPPPHIVKQRTIRVFAKKYGLRTLVETGTYSGAMVDAMKYNFNQIFSIELGKELYEKAKKRFAGDERIEIIHGDSGIELGNLIDRIEQPALFWLDGHYSGRETAGADRDSPIYAELTHIFNSRQRGNVVIIDDARDFEEDSTYPSIEELTNFIRTKSPNATIEIESDSIRIIPHD